MKTEEIIELSKKLDINFRKFLGQPKSGNDSQVQEETLSYADLYSDRMVIANAIRSGIPYHLFDLIQQLSPFSESEWSRLLDLSVRTLQRYEHVKKSFRPIHAEKIIEMAEVTKLGLEVFEYNTVHFKLWLDTPSFALGNFKPIDLLSDSYCKDLVINELTRIEEGIFV